jgi:glycerate 2-kinase
MTDLKAMARRIFHETIAAIDISEAMRRKLSVRGSELKCSDARFDLRAFTKVRVIALGKAARAMVRGLANILPTEYVLEGIVVLPAGENAAPQDVLPRPAQLRYFFAGHPTPDEQSWKAAEAILELLKGCDARTLVFFLVSGGGSALMELPLDAAASLADVQQMHRALVGCGAPIDSINIVRKHLSAVKGGRLAAAADAATKITLAVSDVPPGKESALASGPTIADPTTLEDFARVIQQHELRDKFPASVRRYIAENAIPETPKEGDRAFANAHFWLILGVDDLFHPAHKLAEACGCVTCCDNATDDWPVERAADYLLKQLEDLQHHNPGRHVAVIADGEVSSPVTGDGVGGRNAAFVLACAPKIAGKRIAVLSAGTDGIDGNSPAAGAVADGETLGRGESAGMDGTDYFRRSDAYSYFAQLGDAIVTGPTGNNLRDLRILLAEPGA